MNERNDTPALEPDEAQQLAGRLRDAREFMNLSQQFVSDRTGIPRTAISDIERGERKVDSLELKKLARLYRYPVAYFLDEHTEADVRISEDVAAVVRNAPADRVDVVDAQ